MFSGILYSFDNILITGATADIAFEGCTNLFFAGIGIVLEEIVRGHNHAGGTEATLETVLLPEAFLDGVETAFGGESFDSGYFAAICLYSQNGTGLDGFAVEHYGTSATLRGITADVRSGEVEGLTQIMYQQHTRFHL